MNPQIQKISEQIIDVAFKMGRVYQQEQISEEEKREIAESEDKTYDPHGDYTDQATKANEEMEDEREIEEGINEDKISRWRDK